MVNSSLYDDSNSQQQTQDRNAKAGFKQSQNASSDNKHPTSPCNNEFLETADSDLPSDSFAIEPIPTKTQFNSDMPHENDPDVVESRQKVYVSALADDSNTSICCSVPLDKVQGVLTPFHQPKPDEETPKSKSTRKLLCLYCDRSFVSANLRQKHVERIHSVKQNRRVSSRRQNQQLTVTPCVYCDKLNSTENTLKDLFQHLLYEHSNKYFGCLPCEERFLTTSHLTDHNTSKHELQILETPPKPELSSTSNPKTPLKSLPPEVSPERDETTGEVPVKVTRSKMKPKSENSTISETEKVKKFLTKKKSVKLKDLRNKKLSVKSSRITIKRRESKRIQAIIKLAETQKKKHTKTLEKKLNTAKTKSEPVTTNMTEKTTKSVVTCINPYPEFDSFYRVKKITDHSIDNLKISSLTFDDVFDKAFFNRIKCNIEENLLHHIDGKLFKNEESENRISNFEKVSNFPQETLSSTSENYGCELSLNAVTPVASLSLNSQFGEDFESQIEYGSKPSKKKSQIKTDEVVHYKYFTRRKFQASILEHKENRDLSKLDMWTQLVIKKRQQTMLDQKKSAKEMQEYTAGDEYKNRMKREELNRILDRRGPFEDLKEEASKKAALDKLNLASEDNISHESFSEVREVLNEILNRVFEATECFEKAVEEEVEKTVNIKIDVREIPGYLNLQRSSSLPSDEIDRSDKITLICSSQETENFELPTNQVRGKNEIVELSGEWARCRMYICAACGAKLPNMKYLLEHKSLYHQNVWVQHYEFVGNQSELYRHLSIPALGKVGTVEESVPCKVWKRSEARMCTKCGRQCNSLGELHRHILECGGDWTWMLARKKCKYRPFGTKSRRKRRGLVHRVHLKRKTEPTEKKKYKKPFEGPRQRPSDADSIQRMLANLPAKRSTRKLISLQDGIYRARKKTQINSTLNKKNKVKCGKVIYKSSNIKETTEKTINTTRVKLSSSSQKNTNSTNRRTLRSLNKVLASRIIDSNPKLTVKRKLRVINGKMRTRQSQLAAKENNENVHDLEDHEELPASSVSSPKIKPNNQKENTKEISPQKKSSPKSLKKMTMKKLLTGKINIKSFFPIKKQKKRKTFAESEKEQETPTEDILTRSKANNQEIIETLKIEDININLDSTNLNDLRKEPRKIKKKTFGKFVKSCMSKKKDMKKSEELKNSDNECKNAKNKKKFSIIEITSTSRENIHEDSTNKKRKLKQSFRNVINRVKKLKIDSEGPSCSTAESVEPIKNHEDNQISHRDAFLGKNKQNDKLDPCAKPEKIMIPSILETRENLADISETAPIVMQFNETEDDPQIPERIFRLESNNEKSLQAKGEQNFDTQLDATSTKQLDGMSSTDDGNLSLLTQTGPEMQPISIETSMKPKSLPMISPNVKGKIRKPARGLNDCIAMLTSKLQKKAEEKPETKSQTLNKTENSSNLSHSPNVFRPLPEVFLPKPDCILKIPSFKTKYTGMEETALDLSMKSQSNPELNRNPHQGTLWQMRPSNFLFPVDFAKPMWIPPSPNPKRNSVDQTIEEVIHQLDKVHYIRKAQIKWNSVDEIIQNVIDDWNNAPAEIREIKEVEHFKTRNTVDDIIDFVVGGSMMNDELELNEKVIENNSSTPEITQNKNFESKNNLDEESESSKLVKSETNNTTSEDIIQKSSRVINFPKHHQDENTYKKEMKFDEKPLLVSKKIVKKRRQPQLVMKTTKKSLIKAQEKFVLAEEKKSTKLKEQPRTMTVLEPESSSEGTENLTVLDNFNANNGLPSINNENVCDSKLINNTNHKQNTSQVLDNGSQDSSCLNTDFSQFSDRSGGNTVESEKERKLGHVRKSFLKKINTKEQMLETNVDDLLSFQEINKPDLVTNLGTVMTGEMQEPEIKLTTEDEPNLLENKVLLLTKNKSAVLSDSEDEIPLSILIKVDNPTNVADVIKGNDFNMKKEETKKTIESEHQELEREEISFNKANNKNIDDSLNQENEVFLLKEKDFGKDNEIEKNTPHSVTLEDSMLLEQTIEPTVDISIKNKEEDLFQIVNEHDKYEKSEEILSSNIIEKTESVVLQVVKAVPIGKKNRGRPKSNNVKYTGNNQVTSELSENNIFKSSYMKNSSQCIKSPKIIRNNCSSQNHLDMNNEPVLKSVVNTSPEVFKTPKKIKKLRGKLASRKSSLGRTARVRELPKRSKSLGDILTIDNSEPDTDDETLMTLKMSLKPKDGVTDLICDTENANENISAEAEKYKSNETKDVYVSTSETSSGPSETISSLLCDQSRSKGEILEMSRSQAGIPYIVEASIEGEQVKAGSQHDTYITVDSTDANMFFDSGISDESLENLDQTEKKRTIPKRRGKRNSLIMPNNLCITSDISFSKNGLEQKQNELKENGRNSRSVKRNSEMELSDSSNSAFDISIDTTPETQVYNNEAISYPSTPKLIVKKKGKKVVAIKNKLNSQCYDNTSEMVRKETETSTNITPPIDKCDVLSDFDVIVDNKDMEKFIEVDKSGLKNMNLLDTKDQVISKNKSLKPKIDFGKGKPKPNLTASELTVTLEDKSENCSEIKVSEVTVSTETNILNKNLKENSAKNLSIDVLYNSVGSVIENLTSETSKHKSSNDKTGNSVTIGEIASSENAVTVHKPDLNTNKKRNMCDVSEAGTKVIRKSKSIKSALKSGKNDFSQRSTSVSLLGSAKPTTINDHRKVIARKQDISDKLLKKSGNFSRQFKKPITLKTKIPARALKENYLESDKKHLDLSLGRSRSARNKIINYAENDDGETIDPSTPQDSSSENVPSQITESSKKPRSADRKLETSTDSSEMDKLDDRVKGLSNNTIKVSFNEKKSKESIELKQIFAKSKPRNRKGKRKWKLSMKTRNNKKLNKHKEINPNAFAPETPPNKGGIKEFGKTDRCKFSSEDFLTTNEVSNNFENSIKLPKFVDALNTTTNPPESLTPSKLDIMIDIPNIRKEPPIKIIINKQKTRRKSKSFRKVDTKGQNDLFKDFSLVIKKPKRLIPIIKFTPSDSILKETYPNLIRPLVEPFVEHIIPFENKIIFDQNLDESVEEMDMELDEIPITSNIIVRNALPEMKDTNIPTEIKKSSSINFRKTSKKIKSRRVKSKKARFTKKRATAKISTAIKLPKGKNTKEMITNLQKTEINTELMPPISPFNSELETNTLTFKITEEKKVSCSELNILEKETLDDSFSEKKKANKGGTKIGEQKFDNEEDNVKTDEIDAKVTITCDKVSPEKPVLGNNKTAIKGESNNIIIAPKKLIINFRKKKNIVEENSENMKLQEKRLELFAKKSVNNNTLLIKETENTAFVNKNLTNPIDKSNSSLMNFETQEANSEDNPVNNSLNSVRKMKKTKLSSKDASKSGPNNTNTANVETQIHDADNRNVMQTLSEAISTPIKFNLPNILSKSSKDESSESVFNFTDNEDTEIEIPVDISLLKPVEELSNSGILDNSKITDDISVTQTSKKSSRKKVTSSSDQVEIFRSLDLVTTSKVIYEKPAARTEDTLSENTSDLESNKIESQILTTKTKSTRELKSIETQESLDGGAIKENNVEVNTRRKSIRSAKVKALEHIHDEALAELTDSERNREVDRSEVTPQEEIDDTTNGKRNLNKRTRKNHKVPKLLEALDFQEKLLVEDKSPSFADFVADLAGLEELENSIERELSADTNGSDASLEICKKQNVMDYSIETQTDENLGKPNDRAEQDNREPRRSRRGSKKITSYNENDLIDPILDLIDGKKKCRKKDVLEKNPQFEIKSKKTKDEVKKLNCDELFDLLKSSTNEKNSSQSLNSFSGTLSRISENSNVSDKFEAIFNDVSDCLNQLAKGKVSDKTDSNDPIKIFEFSESPDNIEGTSFPNVSNKRKSSKTDSNKNSSPDKSLLEDVTDNSASFLETASVETSIVESSVKSAKSGNDPNFCEICNKSFIRIENLIKHKRTLTHIQKLSEIEAKQAKENSKSHQIINQQDTKLIGEESSITFDSTRSDINIHNILLESEKPNETLPQMVHSSFPNNDSLKLVDIISDVLNKPSLATDSEDHSFIELQNGNEMQPELRRYKSLGERKSFDSDNILNIENNTLVLNEPYLSKTTILEKQISLLENIIENQTGVSYLDDISMSSNNSIIGNSGFSSKDDSSNVICKDKTVVLNNIEDSFLKPTQYEEISEDSANIRNYEDQKLRKTLNRDEELFLECCSLLKSGSEVSSYSNQRSQKVITRLSSKQFNDQESMEDKCQVHKSQYNLENDYSDGNSRIPTPLGDSYDDGASDSNTISSNWDINKMEPVFEDNPNITSNLNFQEVLNKAINQDKSEDFTNIRKSPVASEMNILCSESEQKDISDNTTSNCKKKIITKGARKVFEGLKVSIPTEELNLEEVLNCSPKCKKIELQVFQNNSDDHSILELNNSQKKPSRTARKSKPVKKAQVGSNLLFKMKKRKTLLSPGKTTNSNQESDNSKSIDVYDFEETQDNTDVFTKPDFRTFRKKKSNENIEADSDTESRDDYFLEPFIAEPESVTSSLSSSSSVKKSKAQENITKKKCMIMGRIFKNQAKSKIEDIDEEMREIPIIDNDELVENYVANCKIIKNEMKPKLSETEINQLFDQLLENKNNGKEDNSNTLTKAYCKLKPDSKDKEKKVIDTKKRKIKNRKRPRTNSESTDDEFNINKSNKRVYRKNGKAEDNSINLEQELKECIGVASRKSQRKCTSGKQNVLVEYWSSDESQFEALFESQKIEHRPKHPKILDETQVKSSTSILEEKSEFEKIPVILKPPPRPRTLKKVQSKRKHTSEKRDKSLCLNIAKDSVRPSDQVGVNRRKRAAANPLYHWSSSSEDESQDLIEIKPLREDEEEFEDERPIQHGWIVGESPKKLVTMLAQAKGKKLTDIDCVKEQGKKRTTNSNS